MQNFKLMNNNAHEKEEEDDDDIEDFMTRRMSSLNISRTEKCIDKVVIENKKRIEKEDQKYNAKYEELFAVFLIILILI